MYLLSNRRAQQDRRQRDIGPPPGSAERRGMADRRSGGGNGYALTEAEYQRYFGCLAGWTYEERAAH